MLSNHILIRTCISKNSSGRKQTIQFYYWAKGINRHVIIKDTFMSNKHIKICSMSLATKVMWIKPQDTTAHLLEWLKKKKNTDTVKCGQGWEATGNATWCWCTCKTAEPLWKAIWQFLTNLNIHLLCNPAIPLQVFIQEKWKIYFSTKTSTQIFIPALLAIPPNWKRLRCPSTSEWRSKRWYIHAVEC